MNKTTCLLTISVLFFSCKPSTKVAVNNNGVHIDYTDSGAGDTTLLFVHGWCINKTYWNDQVSYFKDHYRVVTIDLPGFGQSGKNRNVWSTAMFAQDVDSVISQLQLNHVILIGHSMAGDIVVQAAINAPKQVIALVGVDNFKSVGIPQVDSIKVKAAYAGAITALKHHFKTIAFSYFNQSLFYKTTPSQIKKRILNDVAHSDSTIATACMEQNNFDEVLKLKQAKKKLYLINSDVNPTDTTGMVANKIPYKLFYISKTGHFPMIEKPSEFNALLKKIIADIK
jgi:pimeloyl-ACP methyl ester carboxylesterase